MKKTRTIMAIAFLVFGVMAVTIGNALAYSENNRCMDAMVYKIDWCNDERDYCITTIETEDGNLWEIEDYIVPRSAKLLVTFDNNGTPDNIYDDIITQIIAVNNF